MKHHQDLTDRRPVLWVFSKHELDETFAVSQVKMHYYTLDIDSK